MLYENETGKQLILFQQYTAYCYNNYLCIVLHPSLSSLLKCLLINIF